jgi:hypothetical protein
MSSLTYAAFFWCIACSGCGAVANQSASNPECIPKIGGEEQSVFGELFSSMFSKNSSNFEPMIRKGDDAFSKRNVSFAYTPTNRGWFPAVGVLDVVVHAYPKGRSGDSAYYDSSPFFSSSRHDDFIDVESELDPLTEAVPEGLTGIMFSISMNNGQNFDEFFKKYKTKNDWLSRLVVEIDQLEQVCAVALFRENNQIRHIAMIVNNASSSKDMLQNNVYLPKICARRMNATLAGFEGIKASRLLQLNNSVIQNGTRNERIFGLPEAWADQIKKLSPALQFAGTSRAELCRALSPK